MDEWTLPHLIGGMILGILKVPILYVIGIIILFELFEWTMEQQNGTFLNERESNSNRAEDILVGLGGYVLMSSIQ